jgi:TRAP transporter TAXI family solute receptor
MFAAGAALAAEVKLPKQMTWTAYGTTSTGYQQSVAIGNVLKKNYGMQLNIKTGKNDVARMLPLKARKADFCACGIAFYFAHEGVFMFGKKNWGPQAISLAFASIGGAGIGVGVAKDTGVKKYSDLKGKRIAWIRGSPALNQNAASFLAYGGLTWKDVKRVEFGGWKDSINGIINNQVDAGTMSTISPHSKRIEASPRGLIFPQMDHNDKAAWKRMNSVAPWAQPHMATIGATVSKDKPWTFPPTRSTASSRVSTRATATSRAPRRASTVGTRAARTSSGWFPGIRARSSSGRRSGSGPRRPRRITTVC